MEINRRVLLGSGLAASLPWSAVAAAQPASRPGARLRLVPLPTRVFKAPDLPREDMEAWFVTVAVESDNQRTLAVAGLQTTIYSHGNALRSNRYSAAAAEALALRDRPAPERQPDGTPRVAPVHWPLQFRLIERERGVLAADRMSVSVTVRDESGESVIECDIALGHYVQRTELVFPFRGPGLVTQGGAANGGHRNRSGQFAIDAMGLGPDYAVQTGTEFAVNTDLSGFGRELIAPAGGLIVHARSDRPDQPVPGENNPDYHAPELRNQGDPGNHVIIDHGQGEFSMIAHFMAGSLRVGAGDVVVQGQPLGSMGNSGDSSAPHVHYQLQDGPDRQYANGLPCRFSNIGSDWMRRGQFFDAV